MGIVLVTEGNPACFREKRAMEDAPAESEPNPHAPGDFAPLPLPTVPGIFAPGEFLQKVAGGFEFTEGPAYDAVADVLYFSDIPADTLFCYRPETGDVEVVRKPSHFSNGNALDEDGRLVTCEHQTRRVTRAAPFASDGEILADAFGGKRLNSPNDVVVRSDGAIYFTDPPYGLPHQSEGKELTFSGVYRIGTGGDLTLLTDSLPRPNGLAFSPDELVLYVDDSQEGVLYAFPVLPDGTLGDRRVFGDLKRDGATRGPDGMAVDAQGHVFCTGGGGIWIFSRRGVQLGFWETPEFVSNLCWGDADGKTLYLTGTTSIYKARTLTGKPSIDIVERAAGGGTVGMPKEGTIMWQRFTERSRRVVFYAQEEAGRLGENAVSTEHLLLGLVRENDSVAARLLDRMGVSLGRIRSEIERQVARGNGRLAQDMQLTPRAKRVIDLAYDEARQLNNNYIGTEHLLLGLIREGEGLAGRVLKKLGVDLERTRNEAIQLQNAEPLNPGKEGKPLPVDVVLGRSKPQTGDLGVVEGHGRNETEVALDARAYVALAHIFDAKDAHGYRQMASGDQTMFLLPIGTPLKLLIPTGDGASAATDAGGYYVRVLSGPYDGYAGWISRGNFAFTGPDEADFPPPVGE